MSVDLLSTAAPSRLLCRRGRWALELTRLVPVDSHVFQPRRQRLEGSEAILSHLKRAGDGNGLAHAAAQIMRSARTDEERSFDAVGGEWIPTHAARAAELANEPAAQQRQSLSDALAELRAEVLLLRASHQRLKDRVVSLEAQLAPGGVAAPRIEQRLTPVSLAPLERVRVPEFAASVALPATRAAEPHHATLGAGHELEAPPPVASSASSGENRVGEVVPAHAQPEASRVSIALGDPSRLLEALKELLGGDAGYASTQEPIPSSALELAALYACVLLDADGHEVGAVLADIRATASLGGKLAGLPATLIEEQAKTGVLSETVTTAMSEVCKTLSGALSRVPGNPNVSSTPLESFRVDQLGWVGNARAYLAFERRRAGTFWLVTR